MKTELQDILTFQPFLSQKRSERKNKRTSLSGGVAFALRCRKHLEDLHRHSTGISRTGWSDGTGTSAPLVALWPAAG